jgi:hypothetical protein
MRHTALVATSLIGLCIIACGHKNQNGTGQDSPVQNQSGGTPDGGVPPDGGNFDAGWPDGGSGDAGIYDSVAVLRTTENPYFHGDPPPQQTVDDALVCCTSTTDINCMTSRDGGVFSPSRRLAVLEGGHAPISVDVFADDNCQNPVRTLSGIFYFFESNLWTADVDFYPPLPEGTHLSLKWTAASCETTPCVPYVLGSSPRGCWTEYEQ